MAIKKEVAWATDFTIDILRENDYFVPNDTKPVIVRICEKANGTLTESNQESFAQTLTDAIISQHNKMCAEIGSPNYKTIHPSIVIGLERMMSIPKRMPRPQQNQFGARQNILTNPQ